MPDNGPQRRTLSEGEFTTIKQALLRQAPDGLSADEFQRWFSPRFEQALTEAEYSSAPVSGGALRRFVGGAAEMLNPITIAQGAYQAVTHPLDTLGALGQSHAEQFQQARDAFGRVVTAPTVSGKLAAASEGAGHTAAGVLPVIGPLAAEIGEQIGSGDVAGGLGKAAGVLTPVAGARAAVSGARRLVPSGVRQAAAGALESGAASRVADVIAPKVGPNKARFGNQAERIAPQLAQDSAAEGAPLTRQGFHGQIQAKLAEAEAGLDAAAAARNPRQVVHTAPIIRALQQRRAALTAQTHRLPGMKAGADVVPAPHAARVAQIDQAIAEIDRLGPVANYDALLKMRQAYDGPAKAVYSPSVTADYLKAQGSKLGAADVTGALREQLAAMDPATAAANARYHLYRTADDVLEATREIERVRPRVGRQIMARLTGTLVGGQQAGVAGAAAGFLGGPLLDSALASGATTQLKTAALMQRLASAIRAGNVQQANSLATLIERELKTTVPVQAERTTSQRDMQPASGTP